MRKQRHWKNQKTLELIITLNGDLCRPPVTSILNFTFGSANEPIELTLEHVVTTKLEKQHIKNLLSCCCPITAVIDADAVVRDCTNQVTVKGDRCRTIIVPRHATVTLREGTKVADGGDHFLVNFAHNEERVSVYVRWTGERSDLEFTHHRTLKGATQGAEVVVEFVIGTDTIEDAVESIDRTLSLGGGHRSLNDGGHWLLANDCIIAEWETDGRCLGHFVNCLPLL